MSTDPHAMSHDAIVSALRREFDQSFAHPPREISNKTQLLAIRLAGHTFALQLQDIKVLLTPRDCVSLPSHHPAFEGLLGYRGELFPTYSLAHLVGGLTPATTPRWLVLTRNPSIALSFESHLGLLTVPQEQLYPAHEFDVSGPYIEQVACLSVDGTENTFYPILLLAVILEKLAQEFASSPSSQPIRPRELLP